MKSNKFVAATIAAAGLGSAFIAPSAAFAGTFCPTGSTSIGSGLCEVVLTSGTDATWTPPAGITKLEALLVAGGGAGDDYAWGYAGEGGEVQLVELEATGAITYTVGIGGVGLREDGTDTVLTQNSVSTNANGGGGGGGASYWDRDGSAGSVVDDLAAAGSMFDGVMDCYGPNGSFFYLQNVDGSVYSLDFGATNCGRGSFDAIEVTKSNEQDSYFEFEAVSGSVAETSMQSFAPDANSGAGGSYLNADVEPNYSEVQQDGADGKIVLRFDEVPELAATGNSSATSLMTSGAAVGALFAGAVVLANARRRKNA